MGNNINITPELTLKQKDALKLLFNYNNGVSEVLFGGGAGGGKSYLGCMWVILCAIKYPETRYLIGRSRLTTLKMTTLKTLFQVFKDFKLKETKHWRYNGINNTIKFYNGSEIILKDLFSYPADPDFDSLGSLEITAAFIDEANQVSEKAKNIVASRIRFKLDDYKLSPKILMTCNPAKNWVFNEYYKKHKDNRLEDHKKFIQTLVTDNNFISKHYITNLEKLDTISKNRLLYGLWEYSDDLAIFDYDRIIEAFDNEIPSTGEMFITVDVARMGKDKSVVLIWDGFKIIKCYEWAKNKVNELVDKIKELMKTYNVPIHNVSVDSDGVGGGVVDYLPGCISIMNNSKPYDNENYQNLKTQLYAKLADKINDGLISINGFDDNQKQLLIQELQVIKREKIDQDGKYSITSKETIKNQIGRSPDYSDAMAYRMVFTLKSKAFDYEFMVL